MVRGGRSEEENEDEISKHGGGSSLDQFPAWTGLQCETTQGVLVVSPSPPRIQAAQLRLVE